MRLTIKERKHNLDDTLTTELEQQFKVNVAELKADYQVLEKQLMSLREKISRDQIVMRAMDGQKVIINFEDILHVTFNNKLSLFAKVKIFLSQIVAFVSDDPREANTEGGVFPAIFGTVLMVLLMTVIVSPLGVVAAIYLHEYAGNNALTKLLRIAVINLAGVPSIVYGVFGLGFFVYMVGGSLDQLFYAETRQFGVRRYQS